MKAKPPLPVILFLDPYLTAKVQMRAMDAAKLLAQNVTEARLIDHVLTVFFHHEQEILELLYPPRGAVGWVPETTRTRSKSPPAEGGGSRWVSKRGWIRGGFPECRR